MTEKFSKENRGYLVQADRKSSADPEWRLRIHHQGQDRDWLGWAEPDGSIQMHERTRQTPACGAITAVLDKRADNWPDWRGTLVVDGVTWALAAWSRPKPGLFSVTMSPPRTPGPTSAPPPSSPTPVESARAAGPDAPSDALSVDELFSDPFSRT